MGYGEYDGGGSMEWRIVHGNKTTPSKGKGDATGADGKDHEATAGKALSVCFDKTVVFSITCFPHMPKLYVTWGDEQRCPPPSITARKTGKAGGRKTTAKKR